ncbi:MAG: leucine-rich repeat protein [Oscillospiraceae bacterium]|nr:leucine-rich repeat protein [Oscillospiraceae bacterium]
MKRIYALLTSAALLLSCSGGYLPDIGSGTGAVISAYAAGQATSGECGAEGSNVTWELKDGVLTISGTGAIKDYHSVFSEYSPWYKSEEIKSIIIGEGVTKIGASAFKSIKNLESVVIPASMTEMAFSNAFESCFALNNIEVAADNPEYASRDGVLFSKDMTNLICYPREKEGTAYVIPDSV